MPSWPVISILTPSNVSGNTNFGETPSIFLLSLSLPPTVKQWWISLSLECYSEVFALLCISIMGFMKRRRGGDLAWEMKFFFSLYSWRERKLRKRECRRKCELREKRKRRNINGEVLFYFILFYLLLSFVRYFSFLDWFLRIFYSKYFYLKKKKNHWNLVCVFVRFCFS